MCICLYSVYAFLSFVNEVNKFYVWKSCAHLTSINSGYRLNDRKHTENTHKHEKEEVLRQTHFLCTNINCLFRLFTFNLVVLYVFTIQFLFFCFVVHISPHNKDLRIHTSQFNQSLVALGHV